ncbi:MAG: AAA family ATPase [Lachnospiraceae bacterium]|nr:AAA family ATPase [Lachnospiraceae bacterium]
MVRGTIINILTQKENDWGRYKIEDESGREFIAVGIIKEASVGMTVVIEGTEENNTYGKQYKITSVISTEADQCAGIRRFLTDGYLKCIGTTTANEIIRMYGKDTLDLFESEDGRKMLLEVKGIAAKKLEKIIESYEENKKYKDIVTFLGGCGTKLQVEKIYKKYKENAGTILRKNPYRLLLDIDGFGFKKTDTLAIASGVKLDSKERIMAGTKYVLDDASSKEGHCYLSMEEIEERLLPLLVPVKETYDEKKISKRVVENALKEWSDKREKFITSHSPSAETLAEIDNINDSRRLIRESLSEAILDAINENILVNVGGNIYTKRMYEAEKQTADMLKEMIASNPVRFINTETIKSAIKTVEKRKTEAMNAEGRPGEFNITTEQRDAVYLSLMNRVSIISGGPGRGKTAISEIVALSFIMSGKYGCTDDIIMLAPTGRAAQRITESTGYPAMTVHRAVMSAHDEDDRPKGKLILVDESSMVDIYLARSVIEYAKDCNLVFVGDVDQIASVGPGKVLKDLIDSKVVPCILLKEGHRNSGTIAKNSELINAGKTLDKYCYDEHFVYIPSKIETISSNMINDYKAMVSKYGIKNVMLCTAMKERGEIAVNKLNAALQKEFTTGNPEATYQDKRIFRVGDRVMQTKNDYDFVVVRNGKQEKGIFNGERGTVVKVTFDPEEEAYKMVVQFDDGSLGGYTKSTVANLTLAYATTLHKCQGSEAACMMMGYLHGDYLLLNRALFYTGETRAKKEFRFYGEEKFMYGKMLSAFDVAVGKTGDSKRNTMLSEMLREE